MIHLLLKLLLPIALAGPIVVGRGAGESEYAIIFARTNLANLLAQCQICNLDASERGQLDLLIKKAAQPPIAVFKNTSLLGNRVFVVHGPEVWFNTDLLWQDSLQTKPIDQAIAAAIWVDVLASLTPVTAADLTHLKAELQSALRTHILSTRAHFGTQEFELSIWTAATGGDHLFLRDSSYTGYELTGNLATLSKCDLGTATDTHFNSARWSAIAAGPSNILILDFDVIQMWSCGQEARRARAHVLARANLTDGNYVVDPTSVRAYLEGE